MNQNTCNDSIIPLIKTVPMLYQSLCPTHVSMVSLLTIDTVLKFHKSVLFLAQLLFQSVWEVLLSSLIYIWVRNILPVPSLFHKPLQIKLTLNSDHNFILISEDCECKYFPLATHLWSQYSYPTHQWLQALRTDDLFILTQCKVWSFLHVIGTLTTSTKIRQWHFCIHGEQAQTLK